jgi:hypothetical protein
MIGTVIAGVILAHAIEFAAFGIFTIIIGLINS